MPNSAGYLWEDSITSPAPGAVFAVTPPVDRRWRIISVSFRFVTDANVANRRIFLYYNPTPQRHYIAVASAVQPQGLTWDYSFYNSARISNGEYAQPGAANLLVNALPERLFIHSGFPITVDCDNIQATDQFSMIRVNFEEWLNR